MKPRIFFLLCSLIALLSVAYGNLTKNRLNDHQPTSDSGEMQRASKMQLRRGKRDIEEWIDSYVTKPWEFLVSSVRSFFELLLRILGRRKRFKHPPEPPTEQVTARGSCGQTFRNSSLYPEVMSADTSLRIIGGENMLSRSYPWLVSIHHKYAHRCGGALIRSHPTKFMSDIVVTAAKCVEDEPDAKILKVHLGVWNWYDQEEGQERIDAANYIPHEHYNNETHVNDIALIKLSRPADFSRSVQPICLPEQDDPPPHSRPAIVAGWGSVYPHQPDLMVGIGNEILVDTFSASQCSEYYDEGVIRSPEMFCAGDLEGVRDACGGDIGGPLILPGPEGWIMWGIVSYGEKCANFKKPRIYTNVANYVKWIEDTIPKLISL